ERNRKLQFGGIGTLAVLLLVGLTPLALSRLPNDGRPTLVIGAKTFTEQHILAELIGERLSQSSIVPVTKAGMGSQLLFDAVANGSVDCYVDYTGTIWTNVMKRKDQPSRRQMLVEMKRWLGNRYGITVAGRLGFENTYAL